MIGKGAKNGNRACQNCGRVVGKGFEDDVLSLFFFFFERGGDLWILGHVLNPRLSGENKVAYLCSKPVERHLVAEQNRDEHVTVMLVTYDASPGPSSLFPPPRERIFRRQASRRRKKGKMFDLFAQPAPWNSSREATLPSWSNRKFWLSIRLNNVPRSTRKEKCSRRW